MMGCGPSAFVGGSESITDTEAHTGRFWAVYFKEDTVIAALASNLTGNTQVGETWTAGTYLFATITSITLTSGACIAYKL